VLYCALLLSQFTCGSAVGEQPSPEGQEAVVSVGEQVGPKLTPVPLERRKARLALTPCKNCGSPHTAVTLRIEFFVYLRCPACAHVWSLPKPGHERLAV
jgi:hypothetical protein